MSKSRRWDSRKRTRVKPDGGVAPPQSVDPTEVGEPEKVATGDAKSVASRPAAQATDERSPTLTRETSAEYPAAAVLRQSRRKFFRFAWSGLGSLAMLEFLWVAISFLRPRLTSEEEAGIVIAGPVERYEPSTVTAFQRGKFYLSRLEDGGFLALSRECTHLGCTVPWIEEEGRFVCPCHASAYNQKGEVVNAPAPRPLDLYPIRIENGILKIDTSEPLKRLSFEEAQVTKA